MTPGQEHIEALRRRGEFEREALAGRLAELRGEIEARRSRWRIVGLLAAGGAAAGTVGWKLFGRSSLAGRLGRIASIASLLFGVSRAFARARRFF